MAVEASVDLHPGSEVVLDRERPSGFHSYRGTGRSRNPVSGRVHERRRSNRFYLIS